MYQVLVDVTQFWLGNFWILNFWKSFFGSEMNLLIKHHQQQQAALSSSQQQRISQWIISFIHVVSDHFRHVFSNAFAIFSRVDEQSRAKEEIDVVDLRCLSREFAAMSLIESYARHSFDWCKNSSHVEGRRGLYEMLEKCELQCRSRWRFFHSLRNLT